MPDTMTRRSEQTVACVVCGRTGREPQLRIGEFSILRCACGVRTLDPPPSEQHLVDVFEDGSIYSEAGELHAELVARNDATLADLERIVAPGRLLDVGAGLGHLLEAARRRGWDAHGVDPSPYSVEQARSRGFVAHHGLLHEVALPASSFDAITMLQVVEHLLDPRALVAECRRLLAPGGALLIETPNPASLLAVAKKERFNYWIPPVHCAWYTPPALARLVREQGLRPVAASTWSARSPRLHDGVDVLAQSRLGHALPRRLRHPAGTILASCADALGYGSITQVAAVKPR